MDQPESMEVDPANDSSSTSKEELVENAQEGQDAEKTKASEKTGDTEKAKDSEKNKDTEKAGDAEKADDSEKTRDAEKAKDSEMTKNTEKAKDSEKTKDTEKAKDFEKTKDTENDGDTEKAKDSEKAEDTEVTQGSDKDEDIEKPEDTEMAKDTEKVHDTEMGKDTRESQDSKDGEDTEKDKDSEEGQETMEVQELEKAGDTERDKDLGEDGEAMETQESEKDKDSEEVQDTVQVNTDDAQVADDAQDSTQDSDPLEKSGDDDTNAAEAEKQSKSAENKEDAEKMECEETAGDSKGSNEGEETSGDKPSAGEGDDEEPVTNIAMVMMDDESLQSDTQNGDKSTNKQGGTEDKAEEGDTEETTNPLAEQENTDKETPEPDVMEIGDKTADAEKTDNADASKTTKSKEGDSSSEKQTEKSSTSDKLPNGAGKEQGDGDKSGKKKATIQEVTLENDDEVKLDDSEDIVELPVHKKPAMVVDLADEDENVGKKQTNEQKEDVADDSSAADDGTTTTEGKKIKLRSLDSLVDKANGEDSPANSVTSAPHPEVPAIGDIVEHGVIIGSDEMDGLQLRISNVVGGEDCITGLTVDEDRDSFPSIQISSVTTLINPLSPEDPNQGNEDGDKKDDEDADKDTEGSENRDMDATSQQGTQGSDAVPGDITASDAAVSSSKDSVSLENGGDAAMEVVSASGDKDKSSENASSAGPKLRLSSDVAEVAKDAGEKEKSDSSRHIYHILRSILTVKRACILCFKQVQCEFRITKKGESGTWGFLCSMNCRSQWTSALPQNHSVEKPRLIFEKLCGMCGKDLSDIPRDGQYSWETREFCSKDCLTEHLHEVAGKCHTCQEAVRSSFIGKYCVRFGSDIHQFCSNTCLECYKTKIKVCCYCQKNLESVNKVTSVSNKEYCSVKCLKRAQRRDIGQQNYTDQFPCTVCMNVNLNRYEFVSNQESFQLCSDPCLNVYKYANRVKAVPCCLCFRVMNAEDVSHYLYHGGHQLRVFCSDSCVNVFILSARKIVVCEACKVKKYNFDMVHRQVDEDFRDYFYCSLDCLNNKVVTGKKKTGTTAVPAGKGSVTSNTSSDPPITNCNMCNNIAKAQYHMVMSDNSLRSFCRYACATKYKNTFGFQVNGIQSASSTQTTTTTTSTSLRDKPQKTTETPSSQPEETEATAQAKKKSKADSLEEVSNIAAELLKIFTPPTMVNKMTSCRPGTLTKGVFCKPQPWHQETQTETSDINSPFYTSKPPPILPVPVPVYVPAPMMMYNVPCPVPVFVPIPLPVPVFIPTTAKTTANIAKMMSKIQNEMPEDPFEAEMLLLARASSESAEATAAAAVAEEEEEQEEEQQAEAPEAPPENPVPATDCGSPRAVDELDVDVSCLDTLEVDIPRYPLKHQDVSHVNAEVVYDSSDGEGEGPSKKRKCDDEDYRPKKRTRGESYDPSSDREEDPDDPPSPTPSTEAIAEEFTEGPFLNKIYGLVAWRKWVTKKNAELAGVSSSRSIKMISNDILSMNSEELNYALCMFLKDLGKDNDEPYQPDTVYYLLLGIQHHLFDSSRMDCIFMDFGFEKFTNSFDEITKKFVSDLDELDGSEPGVTRITETMLWECRQLGAHTPQVLLNTLFYFNTKIFKLKTVEEHQALSFPQIVKQWKRTVVDAEGSVMRTTLLKFFTPKKDGTRRKVLEMHENRDDPLRCPVKLYEFYLSKCPESLRNQQGMYYVYPERSCVPDSPTWFSNQTVQPASLAKMLHRTLMVKEVQEAFME